MIGNDIVDRAEAGYGWQRKGFFSKVFTEKEQQFLGDTKQPELWVWVLWSMKESAYKIISREAGIREYAPTKLECRISSHSADNAYGTVTGYGRTFDTKTVHTETFVSTLAGANLADCEGRMITFSEHSYEIQHRQIREQLYLYLSETHTEYTTEPDPRGGIRLLRNDQLAGWISLSHHGRYGAFVLQFKKESDAVSSIIRSNAEANCGV